MYHKMIYEIKPEQLEAVQEKVKMLAAEGRRLDGTKPAKSWKELRDENHELQQRLEAQEDLAEDYKRRYAFAKQHLEKMTEEFANADKARKEAVEQCAKYKDLAESLLAVVAQFTPEFYEPTDKPVAPRSAEEELQHIKAQRKEYSHRYYIKNREKMLENNKKWRAAHPEAVAQYNKKYSDKKRQGNENYCEKEAAK